jgi:Flp pilus assembly protein TadB
VYWAALTAVEIALGFTAWTHAERFPVSVLIAVVATALACLWAAYSARAVDRRAGALERSIPTVATTFIAATVVASPASLPLLFVERLRSVEGCAPAVCHWEAIWYWVAAVAIGTVVIPLVFALRMRPASVPRRS